MSTLDLEFHRRLTAKLDAMKNNVLELLEAGAADLSMYKDQCGYMRALRDVKLACAEIEELIASGK